MMLTEVIRARRAVRAYTAKKVDDETIRALLGAAVQAPSAMNAQPWSFAVVQDAACLKRYSDRAKALLLAAPAEAKSRRYEGSLRDDTFNIFYDAGTLIVICCKERGPFTDADCWLAAENLMLAACDMGLGSCPIGFAIPALNSRDIKEELHIPPAGAAVAPIIVGYPSSLSQPVTRAEPRVLSWIR
jgi:nitroreductase